MKVVALPSAEAALLTISDSVVTLEEAIRAADPTNAARFEVSPNADQVFLQVDTQTIRWKIDGNDPSSTEGAKVFTAETVPISGDLKLLKLIREGANDATVQVVKLLESGGRSGTFDGS